MFQVPSVPSMGRSAHPTSLWRHLEISFFAGHWSISFQCFGGGSIATWDRAGEQLMRNLTGTLTAACINPQIMLRPSLISTNSTWITEKIELHMSGGESVSLLVSSKPFGRKCPSHDRYCNKNVSIVVGGNGNHQSPQSCVSSICSQDFQRQIPNATQRPEGPTHIQIWISTS